MTALISPLAPKEMAPLLEVDGVRYSAVEAGVRYQGRLDVALMHFAAGSVMAGVFTRSLTRSAPVLHCQQILGNEGENGIAILANSGNSNAFTGSLGQEAMHRCLAALSEKIALPTSAIHVASTGVIGEPLPDRPILTKIDALIDRLDPARAMECAKAVMTTDTFAKTASRIVDLDGTKVTISGFAKGSGMIAPDMATMLAFLATDAKIDRALLQNALARTNETSFNAITVDSDTSTSDSVYLGATGRADMAAIESADDPRFTSFVEALSQVMSELAHMIIKDGEGTTKFVEVKVTGAASDSEAKTIAMAIANSPLVKTAIAGEDPNWGRIVAAIGKSGARADRDALKIWIGGVLVAEKGMVAAGYDEAITAQHMKGENISLAIDIGLGTGEFTAWTCDLTKRYIEINADYRS